MGTTRTLWSAVSRHGKLAQNSYLQLWWRRASFQLGSVTRDTALLLLTEVTPRSAISPLQVVMLR